MHFRKKAGRSSRPAPLFRRALLKRRLRPAYLAVCLLLGAHTVAFGAAENYQSPDDFLKTAFNGKIPKPEIIWLRDPLRSDIKKILGHPYAAIRIRFWKQDRRSAWILEEIGKYKPITAGIVVSDGQIEQVKILVYRESHGWEVRYPFFTNQFRDIRLSADGGLSRGIDGISGATLSVNALTRLATLALRLHKHIVDR